MIKERRVKVPAKVVKTPAKIKKVVDIFCDICSANVDVSRDNRYSSGGHTCQICSRDLCRSENANYKYTCRKEYDDGTDCANDLYCPICWDLKFTKYAADAQANEWLYEGLQKKLENTIRKESLAIKIT